MFALQCIVHAADCSSQVSPGAEDGHGGRLFLLLLLLCYCFEVVLDARLSSFKLGYNQQHIYGIKII